MMKKADYKGGRQWGLCERTAVTILATDLMATAAGGTYVVQSVRLLSLLMANEAIGGSQPDGHSITLGR